MGTVFGRGSPSPSPLPAFYPSKNCRAQKRFSIFFEPFCGRFPKKGSYLFPSGFLLLVPETCIHHLLTNHAGLPSLRRCFSLRNTLVTSSFSLFSSPSSVRFPRYSLAVHSVSSFMTRFPLSGRSSHTNGIEVWSTLWGASLRSEVSFVNFSDHLHNSILLTASSACMTLMFRVPWWPVLLN